MELLTKASRSGEMTRREQENLQVAYQAACESMVLLRNDGALPFPTKKIALYGPGASRTVKGGTGSGEVNERRSVTILEGLEDRGFEITTRRWLEEYEPVFLQAQEEYREEKRRQVNLLRPSSVMDMFSDDFRFPAGRPLTEEDVSDSGTDCCVYVVSRQSGEGGDRRSVGTGSSPAERRPPSASAPLIMKNSCWSSTAAPPWTWASSRTFPASTPFCTSPSRDARVGTPLPT